MIKLLKLIPITLILFLIVSCTSSSGTSDNVSWMLDPYDKKYPESDYLIAVGFGNSRNTAVDDALQNLARSFTVDIYSTNSSSSFGSVQVSNGKRNYDSYLTNDTTVQTVSNVRDIIGVETLDVVEKDNKVYARVGLNRKNSVNLLTQRINSKAAYLTSQLSKASMSSSVEALSICGSIYDDVITVDSYILQLEKLTGQSETRYSDKLNSIRSKAVSGKSASINVNMPYKYDTRAVKGIIESSLKSAGLTVSNGKSDFEVRCDIGVYSDNDNTSNYIINNVSITVSLISGNDRNSVSSMEKITSLSQQMAMQDVMKYYDDEIRNLIRSLLGV